MRMHCLTGPDIFSIEPTAAYCGSVQDRCVMPVEAVREIALLHALPPDPVVPVNGPGSVNHVFVLGTGTARCVVRMPIDPLRRDEFAVEQWCLERAAAHGIPTPEVLVRGQLGPVPYLVQTFVDGARGDGESSLDAWEALGAHGRLVHTIDWSDGPPGLFTRFGRDPDQAWHRHLSYNLHRLTADDPLIELGVYPVDRQPSLRSSLTGLLSAPVSHGLRHGDLAPRNLLIPTDAPAVLLDWGQATVGPVPAGDLVPAMKAHLTTGQPSAVELDVFSAALGMPVESHRELLDGLLLLDALDLVRWAVDQRPDRVPDLVTTARSVLGTADPS